MRRICDPPEWGRTSTRASYPISALSFPPHRNLDKAVTEQPETQRLLAVRDRLVADVLARAVVDLRPRPLDDTEDHDQPASRLKLTAGEASALEVQALATAKHQQLTMSAVLEVGGTRHAEGERHVVTLG